MLLPSALSFSLVPSEPELSAVVATIRTSHQGHRSLKCRNHWPAEILLLLFEVPKYFSSEENMAKYTRIGCHGKKPTTPRENNICDLIIQLYEISNIFSNPRDLSQVYNQGNLFWQSVGVCAQVVQGSWLRKFAPSPVFQDNSSLILGCLFPFVVSGTM